jgi:hypothetical protein
VALGPRERGADEHALLVTDEEGEDDAAITIAAAEDKEEAVAAAGASADEEEEDAARIGWLWLRLRSRVPRVPGDDGGVRPIASPPPPLLPLLPVFVAAWTPLLSV